MRRVEAGPVAVDLDAHVVRKHAIRKHGVRKHAVRKNGAPVRLTSTLFALLAELARHRSTETTHAHLLRENWGPAHDAEAADLRVAVRTLRQKIADAPPTTGAERAGNRLQVRRRTAGFPGASIHAGRPLRRAPR